MLADYVTQAQLDKTLERFADREETKANVAEAVAPLATKEEMRAAIAGAIAPLATKEDLKVAMLQTYEQVKHEFGVFAEQFRFQFGVLHDAIKAVSDRLDRSISDNEKRWEARAPARRAG